jgi:hypothetical protein
MNKFETRQIEAAKTMLANGLADYAANSLAYLTRVTKKETTRQEVIKLIAELDLGKFLEIRNNVLVSKVEAGSNEWYPTSKASFVVNNFLNA